MWSKNPELAAQAVTRIQELAAIADPSERWREALRLLAHLGVHPEEAGDDPMTYVSTVAAYALAPSLIAPQGVGQESTSAPIISTSKDFLSPPPKPEDDFVGVTSMQACKPYLKIICPCGVWVTYENYTDLPKIPTPFPCGKPNHLLVDYLPPEMRRV